LQEKVALALVLEKNEGKTLISVEDQRQW